MGCLKAISHLVIIRCKLVPQSFAFDQALPIPTLIKYTFLTLFISFSCSFFLIYQSYTFFYAQTGLIPLLCLLFDSIIVVFDNLHALGLIFVHFYRKNTDIYVYYTDLLCNVFTECLKLCHYLTVIYVIGISFSLIGIYVIMRIRSSWINIKGNIKAYKSYQRIYQALNHQYPDATKEELVIHKKKENDDQQQTETNDVETEKKEENEEKKDVEYEVCGICREPMMRAKKLPCSHKFHLQCLMGWMRYKQSCPICRRSLNSTNNNVRPQRQQNNQRQINNLNNLNNADLSNSPWWLRLFGSFIQIHNVDIIDARNLNVQRPNNNRNGIGARRRINHRHHAPQNNLSTEQQITRISEIFGGRVSTQDIRARLLRTHSMERTIEYFLTH